MTRHAVAPYAERLSYVPGASDLGVAQTVGAWSARLARIAGVRSHAQRVKALAASAASRSHARQRRQQVLADEQFDKAMGFAGRE